MNVCQYNKPEFLLFKIEWLSWYSPFIVSNGYYILYAVFFISPNCPIFWSPPKKPYENNFDFIGVWYSTTVILRLRWKYLLRVIIPRYIFTVSFLILFFFLVELNSRMCCDFWITLSVVLNDVSGDEMTAYVVWCDVMFVCV